MLARTMGLLLLSSKKSSILCRVVLLCCIFNMMGCFLEIALPKENKD